ncbi:MAG: ABC transporter ATP-binding protein [Candidatus Omnitrophica bacterium]|nr:ABC transporter ATP-binding protein [Candidatus Omnitrophota bacterium]
MCLSLLAAFFEGVTAAVLIQFVKGIISRDFSFVKELPVFNMIFSEHSYTSNAQNTTFFLMLLGTIFISMVFKNILSYLSELAISYQAGKVADGLRRMVFQRYLSFGKMFFDHTYIGRLNNILMHYIGMIIIKLKTANSIFTQVFMLAVYIIIMFVISWKVTIFVLFFFPILNKMLNLLIYRIRKTSESYITSYDMLSHNISNILSCISLVRLYSNEDGEKKHFAYLSSQLRKLEFSLDKKSGLIKPLQEIILLLAILFLVFVMSFMSIKEKSVEIASFMVYFFLLRRAQSNFGVFNNIKVSIAETKGLMNEVMDVFEDKDKFFIPDGGETFDQLEHSIEFNHLSFSYEKGRQILKDINFCIEKGKMTAIVGPTGSGKTTIISLLLRFYDAPPKSILINGKDIRDFSVKSLMTHFGYVSQDTLLFNDTIRENITYGLKRIIREEEIISILKKARLYDFVLSLPKGLDTRIGDRGIKLSGGEKQRVSIARALLKKCEVLILDEATSSLDSKTKKLIQEAIDEAVKTRTSIVIAHRLSTIKHADKIVVIENGKLIEEGTLSELLDKKNKFYTYWEEQKFS